MIHVIATIQAKAGKLDEFLSAFQKLVPEVLAEAGCHGYFPATNASTGIEAQTDLANDSMLVIEQWENEDALKAHLSAPHMGEFRARTADLVEGVTINIVEARS